MSSNLPPGCRVSDIPGNRQEDIESENAEQDLLDYLEKEGVHPYEYDIVAKFGIFAVMKIREYVNEARAECQADAIEYIDALKYEIDMLREELKMVKTELKKMKEDKNK